MAAIPTMGLFNGDPAAEPPLRALPKVKRAVRTGADEVTARRHRSCGLGIHPDSERRGPRRRPRSGSGIALPKRIGGDGALQFGPDVCRITRRSGGNHDAAD
jgi:hypothetical protein